MHCWSAKTRRPWPRCRDSLSQRPTRRIWPTFYASVLGRPKIYARLRAHQVAWLTAEAERSGAPRVLFINIDDSLGEKDKHTRHLEPVDWFFDHSESTKSKPRFKNAFCYVVCTMRAGQNVATVDVQLYLREKTVRRLNRKRPKEERLSFRSKYRIARQMLLALRSHLPKGWRVYVQFDSWYASRRLINYVRRQGWHAT